MKKTETWIGRLTAAPAFLFVFFVIVVPAAYLFVSDLSLARVIAVMRDPFFRHVLLFTLGQALLSSILAGVVGIVAALWHVEQRAFGSRWIWSFSSVCFAMPTIVVALGIMAVWGVSGWAAELAVASGFNQVAEWLKTGGMYGWFGILMAHVFFNFPVFLKSVGSALEEGDRTYEKIALSLGASRLRCFFGFTLPQIAPAIGNAFWIVFLYCSSSFVLVLLLGGGPRFTTVEVALFQAIRVEFDRSTAVVLALLQACFALGAFLVFARGVPRDERPAAREQRFRIYRFRNRATACGANFLYIALITLLVLPLIAAAWSGVGHLTFSLWAPLKNSVWIALMASLSACAVAYPLARLRVYSEADRTRSLIDLVASLPLAFSAVFVVFAAWNLYGASLQEWRGSALAIAVAHAFFAVPIVYRPLRNSLEAISPDYYRAAASMGAGPLGRWWWIELPLLRRSFGVAISLAAAYSFGELSAVLVFLHPDFETLPLHVYREMGRYRFGNAAGASLCLIAAVSLLYTLAGRGERRWNR